MLSKRSGAVNLSEKWREQLQERIKTIKNASEEVDRIAILCKNGLRRAPGGETLKFKNGFNVRVKSIGKGNFVEQTLQRFKIPFEDWACNVVYHALTDEEDNPIVSLPKEMRGDIKKLYDAASKETKRLMSNCRKMKRISTRIDSLLQKIQKVVDKIMSEKMAKELDIDYRGEIIRGSRNNRKLERLIKDYKRLVSELIAQKSAIRRLLIESGESKAKAQEVFDSIKYPTYDVGELKRLKGAVVATRR